jgi:hypothetical protein
MECCITADEKVRLNNLTKRGLCGEHGEPGDYAASSSALQVGSAMLGIPMCMDASRGGAACHGALPSPFPADTRAPMAPPGASCGLSAPTHFGAPFAAAPGAPACGHGTADCAPACRRYRSGCLLGIGDSPPAPGSGALPRTAPRPGSASDQRLGPFLAADKHTGGPGQGR